MEHAKRTIRCGEKEYSYLLQKRKGQKHIRLKIGNDGSLRVSAPPSVRQSRVDGFIMQKRDWIDRHLEIQQAAAKLYDPLKRIPYRGEWYGVEHRHKEKRGSIKIDNTEKKIYIEAAVVDPDHLKDVLRRGLISRVKKILPEEIERWSGTIHIPYASCSVRDQKTRWGSSSGKKHISINWRIIFLPPRVQDYLIIHELLHQRVPGHSTGFWQELERIMPGASECDRWLKKNDYIMSILR